MAAWALVGVIRRYALRSALLDHPNERSSHSVPTPRGGGAAMVAVIVAYCLVATVRGQLESAFTLAVVPAGLVLAAVSWLDDRGHVSAAIRAAVHFAAAIWAVAMLGGLPTLRIGSGALSLGWLGHVVAVVAVVAATNFYNFMDGSDGIAGLETLVPCTFGALLLIRAGAPGLAMVAAVAAASSMGFLLWNWQPAKIFMGDVGSAFLGFFLACLALRSEAAGLPALLWVVLLGVFIVDPLLTLLRRMARGERWHAAHRSHAYQRMIQSGWTHARVAVVVGLIDVVLGVVALMATIQTAAFVFWLLAAIAGLMVLYALVERRRPM